MFKKYSYILNTIRRSERTFLNNLNVSLLVNFQQAACPGQNKVGILHNAEETFAPLFLFLH
jgi:hypothetical protein